MKYSERKVPIDLFEATISLHKKIDRFIRKKRMTPSRFGRDAVSDPNFVHNLRDGRICRQHTIDQVLRYIEQNAKEN